MSWASTIRKWYDELFRNDEVEILKAEIVFLKELVGQQRITVDRLQLMLNSVTPAGFLADRLAHPQPRPTSSAIPTVKRWAQIESERYALIDKNRREALAKTPEPIGVPNGTTVSESRNSAPAR